MSLRANQLKKIIDSKTKALLKLERSNQSAKYIDKLNARIALRSYNEIETETILKLLKNQHCSFQIIVEMYKNERDQEKNSCLWYLLENEEVLRVLYEAQLLSKEDFRYIWKNIDTELELDAFSLKNKEALKSCIEVEALTIKEIVDKFVVSQSKTHNATCLHLLLSASPFYEYLIDKNKLQYEDAQYMLSQIKNKNELTAFANNTSLCKYILENFLLNSKLVNMFDKFFKKSQKEIVFQYIESFQKSSQILELSSYNRYLHKFDKLNIEEKQKLFLLCKDDEQLKAKVLYVVESHIQDKFESFDELLKYSSKLNKKTCLSI